MAEMLFLSAFGTDIIAMVKADQILTKYRRRVSYDRHACTRLAIAIYYLAFIAMAID